MTGVQTCALPILWQDMTTLHYFIGVHPTKSITNFTSDSYSEIPDLLIAAELNGYSSEKSNLGIVPLTFEHIMARLDVNLTFRTQWGTVPTVTSVDVEAKSGALVNYIKKTATANGGASNIIMSNITPNAAYEKVLVPQKINNINIVIDGKTYTYNNVDGFELQKGKIQTVNLIVGKDKITLGSVLITEWGDGNTIDGGEAQID